MLVLIAALLAIPLRQLDFLARIQADIGDGRLKNYFLEHALQSVVGLLQLTRSVLDG